MRAPCLMDHQTGGACGTGRLGEGQTGGPGDRQGCRGHFKASPPCPRSHACLDCSSPNMILVRAAPAFDLHELGCQGSEMQSCSFFEFYTKARYVLALPSIGQLSTHPSSSFLPLKA